MHVLSPARDVHDAPAARSRHNVAVDAAAKCEEQLRLILACDAATMRLSQAESLGTPSGGATRLERQRRKRLTYEARRNCGMTMAALQAHRRTHGC